MIRAILHADRRWGIGKANGLMFSLPTDMKFFRETTSGKTVVMGGKTLRSFPGGKPLKNRVNIVLTKSETRDDCIIVSSEEALRAELRRRQEEEIFVIGGAEIYKMLLPYCEEVLVTKVDADGKADTFFENLDENPDFLCVDEGEEIEDNGYKIRFTKYKNKIAKKL